MIPDFSVVVNALRMVIQPGVLAVIPLGIVIGILVGAMPGLSAVVAIGLVIPYTVYLEPLQAIIFLSSIYTAGIYGGGITAILLNIPGAPPSVVTTFDGYPLARQGRQALALGLGLAASVFGTFAAYSIAFFIMEPIANIVLKFGPPELFALTVFALGTIAAVQGDIVKTLLAGVLGLVIGTIGISPSGVLRNFGVVGLLDGINLSPALVGLFALSEAAFLIGRKTIAEQKATPDRRATSLISLVKGAATIWRFKALSLVSAAIGLVVGMLPAAGATVASMVSYNYARLTSRDSSKFGKGEPAGVVAAEVANNASEGGAMTTTLAFGIPGSASAALVMAAFMLHGLTPGPGLFEHNKDLIYAVLVGKLFQLVVLTIIAFLFLSQASRVVYVPIPVLVPIVVALAVSGTYALRGQASDVVTLLVMGIIGYLLRRNGYPLIALVLGLIMGPIAETQFVRSYQMGGGDLSLLVTRPLSLALLVLGLVGFLLPLVLESRHRRVTQTRST